MTEQLLTLEGWRKPVQRAECLRDCSLVIATYRRSREVCALLRHMLALPDTPGEVVVIDGSPDDDTRDAVRRWAVENRLPFELVYVRSPSGLTRQRNVGIDASGRSIVFFLDDDCLPEPGYFRAIRELYVKDTAGAVGAVCGSPVNQMGVPLSRRWRARFLLGLARKGSAGDYQRMGTSMPIGITRPFTGARRVAVMPGCTMSFRRATLERHRFSSYFYGYSQGEDLEMSLRVGRDYVVVWSGDARAIHDHATGGRPASMEKGRMEVRNRHFIWKRHVDDPRPGDRVRFWCDTIYSICYDLASFIARPYSLAPLRHMTGLMRGAVECVVAPVRHEEPAARTEYDFDLATLGGAIPGPGIQSSGERAATSAGERAARAGSDRR